MYPYNYSIPNNSTGMYRNMNGLQTNGYYNEIYQEGNDERFLLAPLVVGGLAGTALGFGIANNNQLNRPQCCTMPMMPYYYYPPQPYTNTNFTNTNSFYY